MRVLVLNCGSSSVKTHLVDTVTGCWVVRGGVDRVGGGGPGSGRFRTAGGEERVSQVRAEGHREAIAWLAEQLGPELRPEAVGHRVVHGGEAFVAPTRIDASVLEALGTSARLAPLHNPPNLEGIRAAQELFPDLPHVAVFDTAFHATLPDYAYRYAVPERLYRDLGVRRYGFHGTSHRWVAERAAASMGRDDLRLVSLHLGNGCSAAAIQGDRCLDTSMGMTPLEGLVMGTRCGDVDAAVPLILQADMGAGAAEVERLLNRECGLKALSGGMSDMRDVEAAMVCGDERARLAFQAFCYRVRKYAGAYAAVLGGLDALVFTAGIGENSAAVREAVCAGLGFLGIRLDPERNNAPASGEREITNHGSSARVWVIPTNEELVIARDTERALAAA